MLRLEPAVDDIGPNFRLYLENRRKTEIVLIRVNNPSAVIVRANMGQNRRFSEKHWKKVRSRQEQNESDGKCIQMVHLYLWGILPNRNRRVQVAKEELSEFWKNFVCKKTTWEIKRETQKRLHNKNYKYERVFFVSHELGSFNICMDDEHFSSTIQVGH